MLENGDELKEELIIDEEEAKKQFLEELRNKNDEEAAALEENESQKGKDELKIDEESKDENAVAFEPNVESEDINKENKVKSSLVQKVFKATLIDTAIAAVISIIGVYIFDFILRLIFGYYVADFKGVYIIALLLILILYPTIMQSLKYRETFGQKYSKTQLQEREE